MDKLIEEVPTFIQEAPDVYLREIKGRRHDGLDVIHVCCDEDGVKGIALSIPAARQLVKRLRVMLKKYDEGCLDG